MPPKGADEVSRVSNQACWPVNVRRGCGIATTPIFQKPRAQWPGRNRRKPLRFCAPEMFCPPQGVTPVNGVRGKATMSTKCSSGAVPGGVLVTLPPWAKSLAARRRRNRYTYRIPPADNEPNPKPAPSSGPSGHLPPEGKAFLGGSPLHPPPSGAPSPRGEGFWGKAFKKETNHSKVRNPLWNSPPWRATAP